MENGKEFGKYYECVRAHGQGKPKMSLAELHERLKDVHTLERYWSRVDAEKAEKQAN